MTTKSTAYVARLDVDYQEQHNRATALFRVFLVIPIAVVIRVLTAGGTQYEGSGTSVKVTTTSGGVGAGVFVATALMIVFCQRYARRLFDYVVGVGRWWLRVEAYALLLLTDRHPPFSLKAWPAGHSAEGA